MKVPRVELRPINLIYYKILMLKMKISYMAWDQATDIFGLFTNAIKKTLEQQQIEIV